MSLNASGIPSISVPKYDLRSAFEEALIRAGQPDNEEQDTSTEEGETEEESETEDSADTGSASTDVKDPEKKRLSDEAASYRTQLREAQRALQERETKLKEFEDKDKSELEKAARDRDEYKALVDQTTKVLSQQAVELAFFKSGIAGQFKAMEDALQFVKTDDIEVDDDGNVDTDELRKRAEDILKKKPYLRADGDSDGDDGDKQSSGRPFNKKKDGGTSTDALKKKFPALNSR